MANQEKVSSQQMGYLLLAFLMGSAIVNIPSPLINVAQNMAWLSFLIAAVFGFITLAIVIFLHKNNPGETFIDYSKHTLGNWFTVIIGVFFLLVFMMMLANIVLDIGLFLKTTLMRDTPLYMFHSLIFLVAALTVMQGIEVMARMFTMLIYVVLGCLFIVLILILPYYQFEHLLPLFPEGVKPVLHGSYIAIGFPFFEIVLFSMLLPFAQKKESPLSSKALYIAFFVNAVIIFIVIIASIMVLGPTGQDTKYTLFLISHLINIQDIITRTEAIVSMIWITGSYMKATIVLFTINFILTQLVKSKEKNIFVLPITFVAFLLSITMYKNEQQFADFVLTIWPLLIFTFGFLPIVLMTIMTVVKKKQQQF